MVAVLVAVVVLVVKNQVIVYAGWKWRMVQQKTCLCLYHSVRTIVLINAGVNAKKQSAALQQHVLSTLIGYK